MGVDYRELQELQKRMQEFIDRGADEFFRKCTNEMTTCLYKEVVSNTPVGNYETITYKKKDGSTKTYNEDRHGGALKRGWEAALEKSAIRKEGSTYIRVLVNGVEYASYVEYGHRQEPGRFVPHIGARLKKAWAPGLHFVKKSEQKVQKEAPRILQKKLDRKMREMLNGK